MFYYSYLILTYNGQIPQRLHHQPSLNPTRLPQRLKKRARMSLPQIQRTPMRLPRRLP
jgi:hypothetical protein